MTPQKFVQGSQKSNTGADLEAFVAKQPEAKQTQDFKAPVDINKQKRVLGACNALIPVIIASIKTPGTEAKISDRVDALSEMIDASEDFAVSFIENGAPTFKESPWARFSAFRMAAEIYSDEWGRTGNIESAKQFLGDKKFIDVLTSAVSETDKHAFDWLEKSAEMPPIKTESEAASRVRLSVAKALMPLYSEVSCFAFWRDRVSTSAKTDILKQLVDQLTELSAEYANKLADTNGIDPHERLMLWQGTIGRVFAIATTEYSKLAKIAQTQLAETVDTKERNSIRKTWATKNDVIGGVMSNTENNFNTFCKLVENYMNGEFAKHEDIIKNPLSREVVRERAK